jgi:hypothetical protein
MKRTPSSAPPSAAPARKARPWSASSTRARWRTVRPLVRGTYAGGTTAPAPKTEAYRDPALLEMARGRPCLLMVPGLCSHRVDTVVAAHSNLSIHGKAGARKADDCFSAWGCAVCHLWLDQGKARAQDKEAAFALAHARQVLAWRLVAMDASEPERFRKAARRALERLNATPIGDTL